MSLVASAINACPATMSGFGRRAIPQMWQKEAKYLSCRLAQVSKSLEAANIEGALHVRQRIKKPKAIPTLFDSTRKYRPDQSRGNEGTPQGGQFVSEGGGGGNSTASQNQSMRRH